MKRFLATIFLAATAHSADTDTQTLRVFIFAGQSNMVGTHSRVKDINRFPPFAGLNQPQKDVLFSYKLGRENMETSQGWIPMQPTRQPLADALGVIVGFVVVWRVGHGSSSGVSPACAAVSEWTARRLRHRGL